MTRRLHRFPVDRAGSAAVEFALTAPLFLLLLFGTIQVGFWLLEGFGLQHAVEMAARCASVNQNLCGTPSATQTYAAGQDYGMNVSPSVFNVAQTGCGSEVSADLTLPTFAAGFEFPQVTWHAQSCFPTEPPQ